MIRTKGGETMKGLSQFLHFDGIKFFDGKSLTVVSCAPLTDYNTKQVIGSKITVVITQDDTTYKVKPDGTTINNLYEKVTIKVPGKSLSLAPGTVVKLVNPTGTVYGEYRDKLSVTVEDIHAESSGGKS